MRLPLTGIVPPMVTPLRGRDELDLAGLERLIERILAGGVDGLFIETHPDPGKALSDGANMLHLDLLEDLMIKLMKIRRAL